MSDLLYVISQENYIRFIFKTMIFTNLTDYLKNLIMGKNIKRNV